MDRKWRWYLIWALGHGIWKSLILSKFAKCSNPLNQFYDLKVKFTIFQIMLVIAKISYVNIGALGKRTCGVHSFESLKMKILLWWVTACMGSWVSAPRGQIDTTKQAQSVMDWILLRLLVLPLYTMRHFPCNDTGSVPELALIGCNEDSIMLQILHFYYSERHELNLVILRQQFLE